MIENGIIWFAHDGGLAVCIIGFIAVAIVYEIIGYVKETIKYKKN